MTGALSSRGRAGVLVAALTASALGAAPAAAQDAEPGEPASYRYALSFSLDLPPRWVPRDDVGMTRLIAFAPSDGSEDDFRENVNVMVEGLRTDSLDAYFAESLAAMALSMEAFEEREAGSAEIAGLPARRVVYEHTFEGRRLRVLAYLVFGPERAYFLTATAPASTFGDYVQTFERIVNSFRPDQ